VKSILSIKLAHKDCYYLEDKIKQQRENKGKIVKMESDLRLVPKMGVLDSSS
jgi:hypothetical protein